MDPAQLTALLAHGDRRTAAALLVRHFAPAVFALCRAMVRDTQLAEDLSQDAFARAFGALDGFRAEASPRTWLLKIARNRCLDHLARTRRAPWGREPDLEPDDHAGDQPLPIDLLARREDAERAMAVLGESERALVVLHFGHGVGYPELADSFGIGQGAVRMRVSRALARMRDVLCDDEDRATGRLAAIDAEASGAFSEADNFAEASDDFDEAVAVSDRTFALDQDLDEAVATYDAARALDHELDEAPVMVGLEDPGEPTFEALRDDVSPTLWSQLEQLAAQTVG
jgi:RNA polymerase sigma-70 factor (ECF subfamily)